MNEQKLDAVVISAIDYKEKDKIVKLFTLQHGIITANLRGVRSEKAKLKFAAQPFCFGTFHLVQKGEYYTIVGVDLQDSFFDLTKDLNNYYLAYSLLEVVQAALQEGEANHLVFINLLKALKLICYDKMDAKLVLLKFVLGMLKVMGYRFDFKNCTSCKMPYINKKFIDMQTGAIVCGSCATPSSKQINQNAFLLISALYSTEIERLETIKTSPVVVADALSIILQNFEARTETKLRTIKQLL